MNQNWQDFISSQGATIENNKTQWPNAAQSADNTLSDLSHFGLIKAAGEDVVTFLQGQLSNDIQLITAVNSQLNAYCTPKGRMLALLRLFIIDEAFYLQLPTTLLPAILKRLSMFVMRSKVILEDVSDNYIAIGFSGDTASELISNNSTNLKVINMNDAGANDLIPRAMMIGAFESIQKTWLDSLENNTVVNEDYWALQDIHAGIPSIQLPNIEAFVPQMANLQLLDGISFTKGCYTGQEIVARMHYLGQLKRRMYRAHIDTEIVIAGDSLFAQSNASGQGAGKVVDARPAIGGGWDLLIVAPTKNIDANDLQLSDEDGANLVIQSLPYSFESTEDKV